MKCNQDQFKQMRFFNNLSTLSDRQIRWLTTSWAFLFRLFIYPLIEPSLFDCLYSTAYSRPANPPQVIVSLLLIQQLYNKTDDDMHDWMMGGDIALQFATNTLGLPIDVIYSNDKQLSRFRERNREYAKAHDGHNPLDECLQKVGFGMWAMMGISLQNTRMDSTQIAANMAKMSRTALVYNINWRMLRAVVDADDSRKQAVIDAGLGHYLEAYDANRVLYHSQVSPESKQKTIAAESSTVLDLCTEAELNTDEGKLFLRVLSEQTVVENGIRKFIPKEKKTLKSTFVQNPVDPWATYRKKAFKEYIGYVLNFTEAAGTQGSQIVSWDLEQNVVQDSVMAHTFLNEADAIMAGINTYCDLLGIEHPDDMAKCQEALQAKKKLVEEEILSAYREGRRIPMSVDLDPLRDHSAVSDSEDTDTPYQFSLDDFLAGFGIGIQTGAGHSPKEITVDETAINAVQTNEAESVRMDSGDIQNVTASSADSEYTYASSQNRTMPSSEDTDTSEKTDCLSSTIVASIRPNTESSVEAGTAASICSNDTDDSECHEDTCENDRDSGHVYSGSEPSAPDAAGVVRPKSESDGDNSSNFQNTESNSPRIVVQDNKCFIDEIELDTYIKEHDFASLPDDLRRQALLYLLRQNQKFCLEDIGSKRIICVDGAYSDDDLEEAAAEHNFIILPTDLLGTKSNPVTGLFTFSDDMKKVEACPGNGVIVEQKLDKSGKITMKLAPGTCESCPYRNDCKADWQPRKKTWKVVISPNAYGRVHTEALMRNGDYNCVGRFRNGVETIPSIFHNVMDVDHMPVGQEAKKFFTGLKVAAVNIKKFFLFCTGKSTIQNNPLLTRCFT